MCRQRKRSLIEEVGSWWLLARTRSIALPETGAIEPFQCSPERRNIPPWVNPAQYSLRNRAVGGMSGWKGGAC